MIEIISLDDFIIKAIIAGLGIAIVCGVMGCFVIWRRMAYFGDSLAHSTLLGVAIGLAAGFNVTISIVLVSIAFASLLLWLQYRGVLAMDSLLGILAHGALSIAIIIISLQKIPIDLHAVLFGDLLTVTNTEIAIIGSGGSIVLSMIAYFWSPLVLSAFNKDLAKAEGINDFTMQLITLMMMTITVALSVRIVGILLITSMLIIPAATARQMTHSPETMAIAAICIGLVSVLAGITLSIAIDTPTSPSIIVCLSILFAFSLLWNKVRA